MKNNYSFAIWLVGGVAAIVALLIVISTPMFGPRRSLPEKTAGYLSDEAVVDSIGRKEVAPSSFPVPPIVGGETAAEAEQRIIKTADLAVTVDGVDKKVQEVITLATGRGGFVQSSTVVEDETGQKSGYVTVRVPVSLFEDTIQAIKELAIRIERESINGYDVTEQYTDLEARLRSAKAQEEQYLAILEKAETVQDILAVQQYLQSIRYEIESLEGQLKSLGNQTEYSTISVTMEEETRVELPTAKFDLVLTTKEALRYVVLLAQAVVTLAIWLVIVGSAIGLPLALVTWGAVIIVRKILRR